MKDIVEEFKENVCSTCKGTCHKGITFISVGVKEIKCKCVDYIKDPNKIEKPKRIEYSTGELQRHFM